MKYIILSIFGIGFFGCDNDDLKSTDPCKDVVISRDGLGSNSLECPHPFHSLKILEAKHYYNGVGGIHCTCNSSKQTLEKDVK